MGIMRERPLADALLMTGLPRALIDETGELSTLLQEVEGKLGPGRMPPLEDRSSKETKADPSGPLKRGIFLYRKISMFYKTKTNNIKHLTAIWRIIEKLTCVFHLQPILKIEAVCLWCANASSFVLEVIHRHFLSEKNPVCS